MSNPAHADLATLFQAQQAAFARERFPSLAVRLDRLERLHRLLTQNEERIADAISADFGNRSRHETAMAEVFIVLGAITHTRKHLKRWMTKRRVATSFHSLPGRAGSLPSRWAWSASSVPGTTRCNWPWHLPSRPWPRATG